MRYYPRETSPFWVEVAISKGDGHIETRKPRRRTVMPVVRPNFQATIHTTMVGLEEDEPLTSARS